MYLLYPRAAEPCEFCRSPGERAKPLGLINLTSQEEMTIFRKCCLLQFQPLTATLALITRPGEFTRGTAGHEFFSSLPFVEGPSSPEVPNEKTTDPCPPCAPVRFTGIWTLVLGQDWEWCYSSVSAVGGMISLSQDNPWGHLGIQEPPNSAMGPLCGRRLEAQCVQLRHSPLVTKHLFEEADVSSLLQFQAAECLTP